jgi:hypothetical protein
LATLLLPLDQLLPRNGYELYLGGGGFITPAQGAELKDTYDIEDSRL